MNNNNQFSRFNLFFRLTFIILLHPLFLPVPLLQGDFRCTPLGSCRLQLQEFKGTTLQSPFKHSFSRILETLDGAVTATPPFERPPGSSLTIILANFGTLDGRLWMAQLEPLLPLSAFQFLKLFCLLELGVAQCMPLRSACHLLVAPAYWDWGSAQCMPLVSGSCFLELAVAQCMPLCMPLVSGSCLLGLGLSAVHATCQWLLLLGIGGIEVHATSCSNFLMVTAEPAGTFV
ncbi:uncharacterized protein HD556DRAFT_1314809 [Suillus plorans]|uniref:Uncharacterized protein n=1 Tax=Suillus plorans TaxID=116603 RepID=A0A9P7A999_9AGAM|nr:uncharacterized protein HD556DRAFT_1314809 [Suillus plorans]KAG1784793.1 hypothetical protein HD556DRAFT_1314809 [Suillus plorans]